MPLLLPTLLPPERPWATKPPRPLPPSHPPPPSHPLSFSAASLSLNECSAVADAFASHKTKAGTEPADKRGKGERWIQKMSARMVWNTSSVHRLNNVFIRCSFLCLVLARERSFSVMRRLPPRPTITPTKPLAILSVVIPIFVAVVYLWTSWQWADPSTLGKGQLSISNVRTTPQPQRSVFDLLARFLLVLTTQVP